MNRNPLSIDLRRRKHLRLYDPVVLSIKCNSIISRWSGFVGALDGNRIGRLNWVAWTICWRSDIVGIVQEFICKTGMKQIALVCKWPATRNAEWDLAGGSGKDECEIIVASWRVWRKKCVVENDSQSACWIVGGGPSWMSYSRINNIYGSIDQTDRTRPSELSEVNAMNELVMLIRINFGQRWPFYLRDNISMIVIAGADDHGGFIISEIGYRGVIRRMNVGHAIACVGEVAVALT